MKEKGEKMKNTKSDFYQKNLPILLTVMILLIGILVPGGPVENRDFSHMISADPLNPYNLFNAFLILLLMTTVTMIFYTQTRAKWTFRVSMFLGITYFILFVIDLAGIFPTSPTQMSTPLMTIEAVDSWISLLVAWFAYKSLND